MTSLELQNRVLLLQRLLWLALVLAVVPWIAIGAAAWHLTRGRIDLPGALSARSFEVRTESGMAVARLTSERGSGVVAVSSKTGRELVQFGASAQGGGEFEMRNEHGKQVVWLGSEPAGGGNLTLRNQQGGIMLVARDNDGHGGGFAAYGADDRTLAFLGAGTRNDGALQTWNANGATIAELCTNQFGEPLLQLHAKDGHVAFATGVAEGGTSDVTVYGPNAQPGATLVADPEGGRLGVFDNFGKQRVRAGYMTNGNTSLKIIDAQGSTVTVLGQANSGLGGFFKAFARDEQEAFYAGVDDRKGSGIVSIFHPTGQQIFAAGISGDERSGIINVHDLEGKMILRAPEHGP